MKRFLIGMIAVGAAALGALPPAAVAQQKLAIKPLAERKVAALPAGPLFWRIEHFAAAGDGGGARAEPAAAELGRAQAAAGPWSLIARSGGKVYLFTLGPPGGASAGATKLAEVGPIPRVAAKQYLLRINEATGPRGSVTSQHSHPGSEAFYVLAGEQTIRSPQGVLRVKAGQPETGRGADNPMQVSSTGDVDLRSLVMFVVDADRPFSSPAKFR